MENAVFTTLCMISDGDGNVLVQERTYGRWQGIAFPGGHVEPNESFTEAAVREVYEETGYIMENPHLCGVKQFPTEGNGRYVIFLYKADKFSGALRSSDEGRAFWVKREELEHLDLSPQMAEMLELFENDEKSEFYCFCDNGNWKYKII